MVEIPEWYYMVNSHKHGPITWPAVLQLCKTKKLSPDDYLWKSGMPNWLTVSGVIQPTVFYPPHPMAPSTQNQSSEENAESIHRQRLGIAIASGVGILSVFLFPYYRNALMYGTAYVASMVLALRGNVQLPVAAGPRTGIVIINTIAALLSVRVAMLYFELTIYYYNYEFVAIIALCLMLLSSLLSILFIWLLARRR